MRNGQNNNVKIILCGLFFMFIQPAYTCTDNRTDTRTAAGLGDAGYVTLTTKTAFAVAL